MKRPAILLIWFNYCSGEVNHWQWHTHTHRRAQNGLQKELLSNRAEVITNVKWYSLLLPGYIVIVVQCIYNIYIHISINNNDIDRHGATVCSFAWLRFIQVQATILYIINYKLYLIWQNEKKTTPHIIKMWISNEFIGKFSIGMLAISHPLTCFKNWVGNWRFYMQIFIIQASSIWQTSL